MTSTNEPKIVRRRETPPPLRPGTHSHNNARQSPRTPSPRGPKSIRLLQLVLLVVGLAAIGFYGYSTFDRYVFQSYQNWAFDQQIAGRRVSFADYLRERTPVGFLVSSRSQVTTSQTTADKNAPPKAVGTPAPPPVGSVLGRVEIGRLHLSAIVREGVDDKTLSIAVGHVPSTSMPGESGNFAIAAHRDTLFRALKDIRKDDLITFQSPQRTFTYKVAATKIVRPTDVSVLRPDGGGLIASSSIAPGGTNKLLTMITCYPFYYVGSAPKRFIVEAELVDGDTGTQVSETAPLAGAAASRSRHKPVHIETVSDSDFSTGRQRPAEQHASRLRAAFHALRRAVQYPADLVR